jgi:methyltransferase (TIGR00027 family)
LAENQPLIRDISDTARWAAVYRARETERPDAVFRDPFARRLAGARGEEIFEKMPHKTDTSWAWITRTYLFDQVIRDQVAQGVDIVVNLAAGLDTRPYRMSLPASLQWVEVDFPELLGYKQEILANETPGCRLERIPFNLASAESRRQLFSGLSTRGKTALIVTEGLLIYLSPEEIGALAQDLAGTAGFERWALEICSPGLLQMLNRQWGQALGRAGAPLKFAPQEGPGFFERYGWRPLEIHSMLKTAASLKRLSLFLRLMALLPESTGTQGSRPWSAICLFANQHDH